jgi:septal ring factor EnvC (AmiA/AmiB activator)
MTGLQTQVERLTVEKTTLNHRLTEASNTKAKAVKEKNEFQNKHKQATKEIKQLEKQVEALQAAAQEREEEVAAAHEVGDGGDDVGWLACQKVCQRKKHEQQRHHPAADIHKVLPCLRRMTAVLLGFTAAQAPVPAVQHP